MKELANTGNYQRFAVGSADLAQRAFNNGDIDQALEIASVIPGVMQTIELNNLNMKLAGDYRSPTLPESLSQINLNLNAIAQKP